MATYKFKCSLCNKTVSARTEYFKKYLRKYFCENSKELSLKYICKECKKVRGEKIERPSKAEVKINAYPKFREIKKIITEEASKVQSSGFQNKIVLENFLRTVNYLLDKEGIKEYNFIIENNILKGVKLNLPFIGEIKMNINIKEKIEDYE
jgi:hypothetical protein